MMNWESSPTRTFVIAICSSLMHSLRSNSKFSCSSTQLSRQELSGCALELQGICPTVSFKDSSALYKVNSSVRLILFGQFVSPCEEKAVQIMTLNFMSFLQVCEEFGFEELKANFRSSGLRWTSKLDLIELSNFVEKT
jgi:hypothetical protein